VSSLSIVGKGGTNYLREMATGREKQNGGGKKLGKRIKKKIGLLGGGKIKRNQLAGGKKKMKTTNTITREQEGPTEHKGGGEEFPIKSEKGPLSGRRGGGGHQEKG